MIVLTISMKTTSGTETICCSKNEQMKSLIAWIKAANGCKTSSKTASAFLATRAMSASLVATALMGSFIVIKIHLNGWVRYYRQILRKHLQYPVLGYSRSQGCSSCDRNNKVTERKDLFSRGVGCNHVMPKRTRQ